MGHVLYKARRSGLLALTGPTTESQLVARRWQCELAYALAGHFGCIWANIRVTATDDNTCAVTRHVCYPSGIRDDRDVSPCHSELIVGRINFRSCTPATEMDSAPVEQYRFVANSL